MISLTGLTPLQVELCEYIWSLNTQEEVTEWIASLPPRTRAQAVTLMHMIIAEVIEEAGITNFTQANEIIDRVRRVE